MLEEINQKNESNEKFGHNVEILLKIIRHGDRDPKNNMLTDFGREETVKRAQESGLEGDDFDVIHAVGSTVGPYDEKGMGRAEATAHIYAGEISRNKDFVTRKSEALAYDKLKTPVPYDHRAIYNSFLPTNFIEMSPEEKGKAGVDAQGKLMDYLLALDSPEARIYKDEASGSMAYLIKHYQEVAHRLSSDRKVFVPAGVHGTYMEFLFQKALVRKGDDGQVVRGFKNLSDIGGQHNVSEAFSVSIKTDEDGKDEKLVLNFDNPQRPILSEMELDSSVINELADKFEQMHPELRGLREKKV